MSGNIRYGKVLIEEGGEISGDIKKLSDDDKDRSKKPALTRHQACEHLCSPQRRK